MPREERVYILLHRHIFLFCRRTISIYFLYIHIFLFCRVMKQRKREKEKEKRGGGVYSHSHSKNKIITPSHTQHSSSTWPAKLVFHLHEVGYGSLGRILQELCKSKVEGEIYTCSRSGAFRERRCIEQSNERKRRESEKYEPEPFAQKSLPAKPQRCGRKGYLTPPKK